jgi:hypothetical protein
VEAVGRRARCSRWSAHSLVPSNWTRRS